MRIIDVHSSADTPAGLIRAGLRADYVYMYPPRQAYRRLPDADLADIVHRSLARTGPVNLYFHYPFCKQVCSFCNLYTTVGAHEADHAKYTDMLLAELHSYLPLVQGRPVDTIYLGGGTPSVVAPQQFERLFDEIETSGLCRISDVPEVAMEVAPETVPTGFLSTYRKLGVNRINLGLQTLDSSELVSVGRQQSIAEHLRALDAAQAVGFDNVCVDLIYGLAEQTAESWQRSLQITLGRRPETICCYPLTLRPSTGFAARGYLHVDAETLYQRYDLADDLLTAAGYVQETHVRWALPRGGYRQKANHWAGQDILGVGAGARGYLHEGDYRNGYSVRHRVTALRRWYERVAERGHGRDSGFILDADEKRRRSVILGLGRLDRRRYAEEHGDDPTAHFPGQISALEEAGAISVQSDYIALTKLGQRHRDALVQAFFSERVRSLITSFDYNE